MDNLAVGWRIAKKAALAATVSFPVLGGAQAQDAGGAENTAEMESPRDILSGWVNEIAKFDFLTVDVGAIEHDEATGITSLSDLDIAFEIEPGELEFKGEIAEDAPESFRYEVHFPEIHFEGLQAEPDFYSATEISFEGGELRMEIDGTKDAGDTVSVTRFTEYAIYDARWAKLPDIEEDPEHPVSRYYPVVEALADTSFSGIESGPVVTISREGGDRTKTTMIYGNTIVGETVHGDTSSIELDGFSVAVDGVDEEGNHLKLRAEGGPLYIEDYNEGSFIRNFAPDAVADGGNRPYAPLVGYVELPDLTFSGYNEETDQEFYGGADSLVIEGIGIRAPSLPILERFDQLVLSGQRDDVPELTEIDIIETVASFYGTMQLGSLEMTGLYFEVPDEIEGGMDSLVVSDFSAAGLGEYTQEGVSFSGPDGISYSLDSGSVQNVVFPPFGAIMKLAAAGEEPDPKLIMDVIPTVGRILYSGLKVNVPGEVELSLDNVLIEMAGHIGAIPTRLQFDIDGVQMPVAQLDEDSRKQLEALGYDRIDASMSLGIDWDEEAETAEISSTGSLTDGGSYDIEATLGGITRALFENPQAAAMIAMGSVSFEGGSVHFEDDSIRDRLIGMLAEMQGTEPETMRQMALGSVPFLMAPLQRPELSGMAVEAVKQFFEGEGNLTVESSPPQPITAMQIMMGQGDPGALADALGVTISAE